MAQTSPSNLKSQAQAGARSELPGTMPDDPADVSTIERLIHQYHADVYRYGFRLSGNVADAEDLTQQVFLAAHQHLDQLRDRERARSWLLSITRNHFLKSLRRQRPTDSTSLQLEVEQIAQADRHSEIDEEQLQVALQELTDDYRSVLLMFYFEEMSYREIAEQLDVAIGTVMSRLSRAKGQLRQKILSRDRLANNPPHDGSTPSRP